MITETICVAINVVGAGVIFFGGLAVAANLMMKFIIFTCDRITQTAKYLEERKAQKCC